MKRFFGWLFLTQNYMDTLSDEQVAVRALGKRRAYEFEKNRRALYQNYRRLDEIIDSIAKKAPTITYKDSK